MSLHGLGPFLLLAAITGLIALLCYLCRSTSTEKVDNSLEKPLRALLQNDPRVAIIVTQLSWIHNLQHSSHPRTVRTRRRMKLVLELRSRIRQRYPNAPPERVNQLSRRLLLIAQLISAKRQRNE